jgi:hypothetical protein
MKKVEFLSRWGTSPLLLVSPFLLFSSLCWVASFLFSPSSYSFSSFFTRHLLSLTLVFNPSF